MNDQESGPPSGGPPGPGQAGPPPSPREPDAPRREPEAQGGPGDVGEPRPSEEPEFQLLGGNRDWQIRIAVIAAVVVALIVWLIAQGGGDDGGDEQANTVDPVAVTVEDLREYASDFGHPIYWLGERPGQTYELSRNSGGNVFLRYLPAGVELGAEGPYTTIGTYPLDAAYDATVKAAQAEGAIRGRSPDGALVVTDRANPTSVYFAQQGSPVQVEIYSPDGEQAMQFATSGNVQAVQ